MSEARQPSGVGLSMPYVRTELVAFLRQLEGPDPRKLWKAERGRGLVSGIDEVFHFLFDDHSFEVTEIDFYLRTADEVATIAEVKSALDVILNDVGDASDDAFVEHPLWPRVTQAAAIARRTMELA